MKPYKTWWAAAWRRAVRTVIQTLASTLPVGYVVTVEMLENNGIQLVYAVAAWLMTGILSGVASLLTSLVTTLPEVEESEVGKHE